MLPNGRILCVLRCQRDPTGDLWTELYKSDDGGQTWQFRSRVNDFGAPGSLVQMGDGRLVIVYGYRLPPFGIRAVVSEDEGATCGSEIIGRDDGGSWDLGYPNAWLAEPGKENPRAVILYFCDFGFLNSALAIDPRVGLFLPCRVTLLETEHGVVVMSINPKNLSHLFNNTELDKACQKMHDLYSDIMEEATL